MARSPMSRAATTTILPNGNFGPIYESEPFIEDVWISGLPRSHIDVSTTTVGGQIYALLEDCSEDGGTCIHIGHAIMDLRYYEGGDQSKLGYRSSRRLTPRWSSSLWMSRFQRGTLSASP